MLIALLTKDTRFLVDLPRRPVSRIKRFACLTMSLCLIRGIAAAPSELQTFHHEAMLIKSYKLNSSLRLRVKSA